QAEDGIRDGHVTGVQTCALPISVIGSTRGTSAAGAAGTSTAVPLAPMTVSIVAGLASGTVGMRVGGGDVYQSIVVAGGAAGVAGSVFAGFHGPNSQASGSAGAALVSARVGCTTARTATAASATGCSPASAAS